MRRCLCPPRFEPLVAGGARSRSTGKARPRLRQTAALPRVAAEDPGCANHWREIAVVTNTLAIWMISLASEEAAGVIRNSLQIAQKRAADQTSKHVRMILQILPGTEDQIRDRCLKLCTVHFGGIAWHKTPSF